MFLISPLSLFLAYLSIFPWISGRTGGVREWVLGLFWQNDVSEGDWISTLAWGGLRVGASGSGFSPFQWGAFSVPCLVSSARWSYRLPWWMGFSELGNWAVASRLEASFSHPLPQQLSNHFYFSEIVWESESDLGKISSFFFVLSNDIAIS